jgi:hypothetical protein
LLFGAEILHETTIFGRKFVISAMKLVDSVSALVSILTKILNHFEFIFMSLTKFIVITIFGRKCGISATELVDSVSALVSILTKILNHFEVIFMSLTKFIVIFS